MATQRRGPAGVDAEPAEPQPAPTTEIRLYKPSDIKELKMLLGMHAFEPLPVANQQGEPVFALLLNAVWY